MATSTSTTLTPSDKAVVKTTPTGAAGRKAFLESLYPEELSALKRFKLDFAESCEGRTDAFLMKFLWARKLDLDRAAELLQDHLKWRKQWNLDDLDVSSVREFLKAGFSMWVPGLYNKQGYSATFIVPRKLDLSAWKKLGTRGMLHAVWYITDLAVDHDINVGREGTVVVFDFVGASWSHLWAVIKPDDKFDLSKLIEASQNHLPSRIRDVILLNSPFYIRTVLQVVKPLLKSSLREKIHFAKNSDLTHYFTPDHIPVEWQGSREFDLHAWSDQILKSRPTLSEGEYTDASPRSKELISSYTTGTDLKKLSKKHSKHSAAAISLELSQAGKREAQ